MANRTGETCILADRITQRELEAMWKASGLSRVELARILGSTHLERYLPCGRYEFRPLEVPGVREVFRLLGVGRDGKLLGRPRSSDKKGEAQ